MMHSCILLAIAFASMAVVQTNQPQVTNDIDQLQQQRISLLQERLNDFRELQKLGRLGKSDLIAPEMDLLRAQLDYETDKAKRELLFQELLSNYDLLIEIAEVDLQHPPVSAALNEAMPPRSQFLFLKSERLKIQIQAEQEKNAE